MIPLPLNITHIFALFQQYLFDLHPYFYFGQVLSLPSFIWKMLSGQQVTWTKDFVSIDEMEVGLLYMAVKWWMNVIQVQRDLVVSEWFSQVWSSKFCDCVDGRSSILLIVEIIINCMHTKTLFIYRRNIASKLPWIDNYLKLEIIF